MWSLVFGKNQDFRFNFNVPLAAVLSRAENGCVLKANGELKIVFASVWLGCAREAERPIARDSEAAPSGSCGRHPRAAPNPDALLVVNL